jgi:membrane glycosyltransferase
MAAATPPSIPRRQSEPAWQRWRVPLLRAGLVAFAFGNGVLALSLFRAYWSRGGVDIIESAAGIAIFLGLTWLAWGAGTGLLGLFATRARSAVEPPPAQGRTVVLVPIYNEDPASTFARVAAMATGLGRLGLGQRFDIAILSDTTTTEIALEEAAWFARLASDMGDTIRIFYRRRERNIGRKAGNIEDFITRSGGAYDYAVILDADSLVAPETLATLAARMEADPGVGLIQTVPQIVSAQSVFGRIVQFSANYYSAAFAAGTAMLQGAEGPYWGHNAIVRVRAFAESCGLPVLSGKPPFGGAILSHDYVEAALLSRAGWRVELHPDLGGSYEEGPENFVEFAKRDRRWCQGNLQYLKLLPAPRLRLWNRIVLTQGVMSYMASPLWLAFLTLVTLAADRQAGAYPGLAITNVPALLLAGQVAALLVLPRVLIVLRNAIDGTNRSFGGTPRVLVSVVGEIVFSTALAPVMLMVQCRAIWQILTGRDGGWPATQRGGGALDRTTAWRAVGWIVAFAAAAWVVVIIALPESIAWLSPVLGPMLLAPVLVGWSSAPRGPRSLFSTPQQAQMPAVDADRHRVIGRWLGAAADPVALAPAATAERLPAGTKSA